MKEATLIARREIKLSLDTSSLVTNALRITKLKTYSKKRSMILRTVPELTNSFSAASLAVFNSTATNSTIWNGEQGNIIKLKLAIQKSSIKSVSRANKSFKLHYEYCIS